MDYTSVTDSSVNVDHGRLVTFVDAPSPLNVGWRFTGFSIRFERLPVRYRATITTPNGAWVDRGTGFVSLIAEQEVTTACPLTNCSSESSAAGFEERYR